MTLRLFSFQSSNPKLWLICGNLGIACIIHWRIEVVQPSKPHYVPLEPRHKSFFYLDVSRWLAAAHLFAAPTIWLQRCNMGRKLRESLSFFLDWGGMLQCKLKSLSLFWSGFQWYIQQIPTLCKWHFEQWIKSSTFTFTDVSNTYWYRFPPGKGLPLIDVRFASRLGPRCVGQKPATITTASVAWLLVRRGQGNA